MNIFNTPQTQMKAKSSASTGGSVLDVLGNSKNLTPEQIKLLQKQGKLKGDTGAFETLFKESTKDLKNQLNNKNQLTDPKTTQLLKNNSKENQGQKNLAGILNQNNPTKQNVQQAGPQVNQPQVNQPQVNQLRAQIGNREFAQPQNLTQQNVQKNLMSKNLNNAKQSLKLNHNKDILNQPVGESFGKAQNHQVTPQGETKVARVLKLGQSRNVKTTSNNPNMGVEKILQQKATKNPNLHALKTHQPLAQVQAKSAVNVQNQNAKKGLMDFNTFMMKQTPQARGRIAAKSEMYAASKTKKSMFANKVEASLTGVSKKPQGQMKLQDVMLSQQNNEQMGSNLDQSTSNPQIQNLAKAGATIVGADQTAKVFDMSSIAPNTSVDAVITKIQDYAIQTRAGNEPELEFSFKHQDLGRIDLLVQKTHGDQMNISIGTNSIEGMKFFNQNQGELLQSLTQAGLSVSDLKLENGKSSNQNLAGDSGKNQSNGQNKEHNSESGERQEDQKRRSDLWEDFRDKEAA